MNIPISLAPGSNILVAGAGGGFDVICAMPVILSLRKAGHNVELANYSFTFLSKIRDALNPMDSLYGVNSSSKLTASDYCPEIHLARWWKNEFGEDKTIWCYSGVGVKPLSQIFQALEERLKLDAILILDGGVDGLFYGNEYNTGTPSMDAVSVIAGSTLKRSLKYYAFTAFGTEGSNQEVRHADALLRVSELVKENAFLGVSAPKPNSEAGLQFVRALDFIHSKMDPIKHSIMAGSIKSALKGDFGLTAFNAKTKTGPVWISPLTMMYWYFDLDKVASAKPIYNEVLNTDSVMEVADAFERVREKAGAMPRADIPI